MKVYLSGDNVVVDKSGEALLNIRQDRAKFIFVTDTGDNSPTLLTVLDTFFGYTREDLILSTQSSTGDSVGADNDTVRRYLSKFIFKSSQLAINQVDISSSANQEVIIEQNNNLIADIKEVESNTKEIKRNKELIKETNKFLKKIYN